MRATPRLTAQVAPERRFSFGWRRIDVRVRIFVTALLLSGLCGAIEFGEPLEDVIKGTRDLIRQQPYRGNAVVVGVDDKTLNELGGPPSFTLEAKVADSLFAMGAKRVMFDTMFTRSADVVGIQALSAVSQRYDGRMLTGAATPRDPSTRKLLVMLPAAGLRREGAVVSLNGRQTPFNLSEKLTQGDTIGGMQLQSLSAALADRTLSDSRGDYRPDWSIDWRTIPTLSYVDVLKGRVPIADIAGRDIVIGPTAFSLRDIRTLIFQGVIPGVHLQVIGGETLERGTPSSGGWLPCFILAITASIGLLVLRSSRARAALTVGMSGAFLIVPLICDMALVTVDIVPSVLLFGIVAARNIIFRNQRRAERSSVNTGLPNFIALQREPNVRTLVVMKLRNLARITASFDTTIEGELIAELCRRIRLDPSVTTIYHSEDLLAWSTPLTPGNHLSAHLEGLHRVSTRTLAIAGRDLDLSISFGVDSDIGRQLVSRIGSAVQSAEEAAGFNDLFVVYDPARRDQEAWRLALMSRLDSAIDNGELRVVYQLQQCARTGMFVGAEALVRWHHPEQGVLSPDDFIPAAEECHRMDRLTLFVANEAIRFAARALASGIVLDISVNVPAQLVTSVSMPHCIRALLTKHAFPGEHLILEVTENGTLDLSAANRTVMSEYTSLGVQTSVDDFGTGQATLERLRKLHAHEVKIDKQFVQGIDRDHDKSSIVDATIRMAHDLGLRVVAEGVERAEERNALRAMGCDRLQGYLIAKPASADALLASNLLIERRSTAAG